MMCLKAAEATGARPRARFLALQFALIIVKVQCGVAKTLPTVTVLKCLVALNPSVIVDCKYYKLLIQFHLSRFCNQVSQVVLQSLLVVGLT